MSREARIEKEIALTRVHDMRSVRDVASRIMDLCHTSGDQRLSAERDVWRSVLHRRLVTIRRLEREVVELREGRGMDALRQEEIALAELHGAVVEALRNQEWEMRRQHERVVADLVDEHAHQLRQLEVERQRLAGELAQLRHELGGGDNAPVLGGARA